MDERAVHMSESGGMGRACGDAFRNALREIWGQDGDWTCSNTRSVI